MKPKPTALIEYEVVRSNRRTADLVLERDGRLVVRAPEWVSEERIQQIVESKYYWIFSALAEWQDLNSRKPGLEYRSGEGFLYLGRSYRLKLVSDQHISLVLKDGRFCLQRELAEGTSPEPARAAFRAYYCSRGADRIPKRVAYFAPKVGMTPSSIEVRDTGFQWATCGGQGDLAFHWKCMMAPLAIIDYIVIHELCHLRHRNHTDEFWNEVDKVLPDYRARKEWLRVHGAALEL